MISIKKRIKKFLISRKIFYSRFPIVEAAEYQKVLFEKILQSTKGVLHIGAHLGQEAKEYEKYELDVIWIEAIPEVASKLKVLLGKFETQEVFCVLLGSENRSEVAFNLSSNNFESSSIYEFGSELGFDNLEMTKTIMLPMVRMDSFFSSDSLKYFNLWVIDVQGAELDVLLGAGDLIKECHVLLVEVSTREVYFSGTKWVDLKNFLNSVGLIEMFTPGPNIHSDILFIRI
jgi:hypothetical protein